jgi:hypothetical protein
VTLARVFTSAWTSHGLDTAAAYLADDVIFDGPINHTIGKTAYVQGLAAFARTVTGASIVATFGDDSRALIMYDVSVPFGILTCAELFTFRDGKIQADRLTFDTFNVRQTPVNPIVGSGQPTS